jgi:hypothetical protein
MKGLLYNPYCLIYVNISISNGLKNGYFKKP